MNKGTIIGFVVGAAVGVGTTFFVLKDYYQKRNEADAVELKKYYDTKIEALKIFSSIEDVDDDEDDLGEFVGDNKVGNLVYDGTKPDVIGLRSNSVTVDETDYNEIIHKLNYNEFSTKPREKKEHEPAFRDPFLVSIEAWEEVTGSEKKILSYFADDEVLVDAATDEVIEDIARTVGHDNLETIVDSDDGSIYVHSDYYNTDYQVVLEQGSYADFVADEY